MTPSLNLPGCLRRMASQWPADYSRFPKLWEHFTRTSCSSDSDVKTAAENLLIGKGRNFYQAGLDKYVLHSDKHLNIFGDYVEQ
ncbi:hypothetical protein AVEN_90164-1 [Araneus ventricosus]|uniref:Uncharacterized protein n=1 Tax=Araneus ventricosus TaxID=182803 RepID=A0A4Y2H4D0_ARAVE|nr:hypothetical protein AVEN_90164-1 [Araneus ventricosus]